MNQIRKKIDLEVCNERRKERKKNLDIAASKESNETEQENRC